MPGEALVTINDNQWSVEVATTTSELITGLSGRASIPAGTGMLFVLPARQLVTVDTSQMLFPIDIIFIKDDAVLDIAPNIQPGYLVEEATPIDMFLEVNAGEAALVEAGDTVSVTDYSGPAAFDFTAITSFAVPLAVLGFVCAMAGGMASMMGGSSLSKQLSGGHSSEYYWEITDIDTGEIIQKGKPYTTISKVYRSARDYQRRRPGKDKENLVVIRIFDTPNIEEWGKTIKPVMESGMHRGIPILIGKTPLQEAALDRLWPYSIKEIHSDGDLTISSAGKKYIVTTEGGVFVHYTGEEALGKILGENPKISCLIHPQCKAWVEVNGVEICYECWNNASSQEREWFKKATGMYQKGLITRKELDDYIESISYHEVDPTVPVHLSPEIEHSIHGEPRRRLVDEYGTVPSPPEHHSMWLTLEQRKELEKKYGMVAVRWAEEATKPGDIKAAERAAEYYYGKVKEALGLGHLSPELSEEQIMKLREVLGLPVDVSEILKIHQETGYVP